ncbi:DUF429 domain-containing protein [Chitinimonas koreensis]|uniref:DUF429 domain-containing protein n=1 Tax=Chitinimonas koreensis TaxID=356302 RepID=UPI00040D84F3|nr:DUF429 domain-containing protein [Chitinimonas koreensis]QNM95970.1 DUF429 domain-containing protein [Chitinimonas koreensis]
MRLLGIDFTSRPSRRKPITVARGRLDGDVVQLDAVDRLADYTAFETLLAEPGPWLAACDFPFGLPRELVDHLGWPRDWPALMRHLATLDRAALTAVFKAFCDARPAGGKFAHRAADLLARSSPSMKWVNPPVAWMLHEGATRLQAAGLAVPGLQAGDGRRVALEGYPALVARAVIGNASYKSDDRARQTPERRERRAEIVAALCGGRHPLGLRLAIGDAALAAELVDEPGADLLDAVLCLMQAGWAQQRAGQGYGLPAAIDPIEGWIVTAG